MGVSNEVTVTAAVVAAIDALSTDLGFSSPSGNVKDYLLEHEAIVNRHDYLMSTITGGDPEIRRWAVDVEVAPEAFYALGPKQMREYSIRVVGYYEVGVNGSGVKALRLAQRKILKAIRDIETNLSGTVDKVDSVQSGPVVVTENPLSTEEDLMLVAEIVYSASKALVGDADY